MEILENFEKMEIFENFEKMEIFENFEKKKMEFLIVADIFSIFSPL